MYTYARALSGPGTAVSAVIKNVVRKRGGETEDGKEFNTTNTHHCIHVDVYFCFFASLSPNSGAFVHDKNIRIRYVRLQREMMDG